MFSVTSEFYAAETGVFLDLDSCPIPVNLTPASVYDNIKSSLANMGYTGTMSIVAYSSKKKLKNEQDFESANIKLVRPETTTEILVDVYSWVLTYPYCLTNLMVISEDISNYLSYDLFKEQGNNILLAFPQDKLETPGDVASLVWLWSSLSAGGYPLYNNPLGIPIIRTSISKMSGKKGKELMKKKKKKKKNKKMKKKRASTLSAEGKELKKKKKKKKRRATTQSTEISSPNPGKARAESNN